MNEKDLKYSRMINLEGLWSGGNKDDDRYCFICVILERINF